MAGQLFPTILICLQETTGHFGPIVLEQLPKFSNIFITCSNSGKMTRDLVVNLMRKLLNLYLNKILHI